MVKGITESKCKNVGTGGQIITYIERYIKVYNLKIRL